MLLRRYVGAHGRIARQFVNPILAAGAGRDKKLRTVGTTETYRRPFGRDRWV